MRAVRYYGPGDIRVDDIPEPVAGDDQVKIKVGSFIHGHSSIRTLLTRRGDRRTVGRMVSHFRLRHRSRCSITCLTINLQERK